MNILDVKPARKGALLCVVWVQQLNGQILNDYVIFSGERGPWASPLSKPLIGRDGQLVRDASGETRYSPVIEFASREIRDRWSEAVLAALRAPRPDALS